MAGIGEESRPIVIDNGTGTIRAGFASDDKPKLTMSNLYGRLQDGAKPRVGDKGDSVFFGNEAERLDLVTTCPMERGKIQNLELMEKMWHYTFQQLQCDPSDHPVFITEQPLNSKDCREWMIRDLFESFAVPSAFIANQAPMAAYDSGYVTGLVVDSGYGVSHAVPVYDGYSLPHAVQRSEFGGHDVSLVLEEMLKRKHNNFKFTTVSTLDVINDIKHHLCFVQDGSDSAQKDSRVKNTYELPGGQVISVNEERFQAPESLFKPSILGVHQHSALPEMAYKSFLQSGDFWEEMYHRPLVLCGGNTMFSGCSERMAQEFKAAFFSQSHSYPSIKVLAPPCRDLSVWRGTSILASLPDHGLLIRKEEYEEYGPHIVQIKCFT